MSALIALKQCKRCQNHFPPTLEYFGPDAHRKDGFRQNCRLCTRLINQEWRARNTVHVNAYARKYKEEHGDLIRERDRKRRPAKGAKAGKPVPVFEPDYQKASRDFLAVKTLKAKATVTWYKNTLTWYGKFLEEEGLPQWPPDPDNINAYLARKKEEGCTPNTLHSIYRALKTWLTWLIKRKRIEAGIIELIEKPQRRILLPKVVQTQDILKFLDTIRQAKDENWRVLRDLALFTLALDTGARIGEMEQFTLRRLDMVQRTINLDETKSGADRYLVFSPQAAEVLEEWLQMRAELGPETDAIFINSQRRGEFKPLTNWGMRQILEKWQIEAGIEKFNFHRLRHSYAVYTLRAGGDLLDVQKQMGHTSIATTAIYTRVDDTGRQQRHAKANPLSYLGTL